MRFFFILFWQSARNWVNLCGVGRCQLVQTDRQLIEEGLSRECVVFAAALKCYRLANVCIIQKYVGGGSSAVCPREGFYPYVWWAGTGQLSGQHFDGCLMDFLCHPSGS